MTKKHKAGNYTAKHFNHVLDEGKTAITAVYCPFGYVVWLDTNLLYACGNYALESTTVVDEEHPHAEGVKTIKELAVSMAEEISNSPDLHDLELKPSVSVCVTKMGTEPGIFDLALFLGINNKKGCGGATRRQLVQAEVSLKDKKGWTHRKLIEGAIRLLGESSGAWNFPPSA